MRPLVEAYRDEFQRDRRLSDAKVIELFVERVHDSLAGFDVDRTWLSDPRILYVGGDGRLRYAAIDRRSKAEDRAEAA